MKTLFIPTRSAMDRPLLIHLWLAFGITWGVGGLALLAGEIRPGGTSPLHPLHYVAAFGPSIAGVVMAASTHGWAGVRVCSPASFRPSPLCRGTSPSSSVSPP
jgi:hypothetical protein